MRLPFLKKIDVYIIKKFLGTFIFSIIIILSIAVIFDLSEKIDDFMENDASLREVIFDYYLNFIPYFAVLFSSLFTFISVIFFTSKMAYNTEIIAIISSGMSLHRLLRPYFISAFLIAVFSFLMSNYVIPPANKVKLDFEEKYIHSRPFRYRQRNIHKQISPGVYIYMESYSNISDIGYKFSMEKFEDGKLVSKLMSDYIRWDTTEQNWEVRNFYIREVRGPREIIREGRELDTTLNIHPEDFSRRISYVETMSIHELNDYIEELELQGESNISMYQIEKHKRYAFPFSTFVLTLVGVSVSSRKIKGGMGMQIGLGLLVSFAYILFMQFSTQFAVGGSLSPFLAAWIPNILFAGVAFFLYKMAPK